MCRWSGRCSTVPRCCRTGPRWCRPPSDTSEDRCAVSVLPRCVATLPKLRGFGIFDHVLFLTDLKLCVGNRFDCVDTTLSLVSTQRVMYLSDGINKILGQNLLSPPGIPFCERTLDNTMKAMRKPMVEIRSQHWDELQVEVLFYFLAWMHSL